MKERLKSFFFYGFIIYSIIIILLISARYFSYERYIFLSIDDLNIITNVVNNAEDRVNNIEQNECTDVLRKYINYYRSTLVDGAILIKDFVKKYDDNSYDLELYNKCKIYINDDNINMFKMKIISHLSSLTDIYSKYIYAYELHILDYYANEAAMFNDCYTIYKIVKYSESEIISTVIDSLEKEGDINE